MLSCNTYYVINYIIACTDHMALHLMRVSTVVVPLDFWFFLVMLESKTFESPKPNANVVVLINY